MDKLWAGRFSKALDQQADDFNSSIAVDQRMFRQDIKGSMAHAAMLGAKGIIDAADAEKIISGLAGILEDLEQQKAAYCTQPKRSGSLGYSDVFKG